MEEKPSSIESATILHSNEDVKRIPLSNYHVNSDDFYLTLLQINWSYGDILISNQFFCSKELSCVLEQ